MYAQIVVVALCLGQYVQNMNIDQARVFPIIQRLQSVKTQDIVEKKLRCFVILLKT